MRDNLNLIHFIAREFTVGKKRDKSSLSLSSISLSLSLGPSLSPPLFLCHQKDRHHVKSWDSRIHCKHIASQVIVRHACKLSLCLMVLPCVFFVAGITDVTSVKSYKTQVPGLARAGLPKFNSMVFHNLKGVK